MHSFTPEDLLEFHYGEMSESMAQNLKEALQKDWTLREKMRVIREATSRLDKSYFSPRAEVLDHIVAYAMTSITKKVTP
jgi:hypothetical protein